MIKILKASAGSGKTYHLALEYLRLLLSSADRFKYRGILAVTFTNKATDEMKGRILKELHILATEPEKSDYFGEFVPGLFPDAPSLRKKAETCLCSILHDYSSFAVSTIDRFFQQALRAFSREIGQFTSYQVELDRDGLVDETVDRILDSLTEEDDRLLEWLKGSVMSGLMNGKRFNLEPELKSRARELKSEQHGEMVERYGIDESRAFSLERLRKVMDQCRETAQRFAESVRAAATAVLDTLSAEGVAPEDSYKGFLKVLYSFAEAAPEPRIQPPTDAFRNRASDSKKWFASSRDALRLRLEGVLEEPLARFMDLFGEPYKAYRTALLLQGQMYSLGIAGALREQFTALQQEKNILSIDDSNQILRQIIDGSDAPFIYEKLGVRFEDFLLDEFQDTSAVQWENFLPLLTNSEAGGFDNLVVGDVKQSIYRWRGSDWNLLQNGLQAEFGSSRETPLRANYRTLGDIVRFNNVFFDAAARRLDGLLGEPEEAPGSITSLYADVEQQVKVSDPSEGSVELVFLPDAAGQCPEILDTVSSLLEAGAGYGDIAVLVRNNTEGSEVATALIAAGIPVVSDDSLFVKSSVTVRRLVSLMSLADAPLSGDNRSPRGFLARSLSVTVPSSYHSLTDLAETLLRGLRDADPGPFGAETAYIHAFMDTLQEWTATNGNHLSAFLKFWEGENPKVSSPQAGASVRVMTIHKSKGLEFPFVIFAFAEKIGLFRPGSRWCRPETAGTPLEGLEEGIYPVYLSGQSEDTLFSEDYCRERKMQYIDNLNLFYVAMTRPRCGIKVLSTKAKGSALTSLSQILYDFALTPDAGMIRTEEDGVVRFTRGTPYDFRQQVRKAASVEPLPLDYPSFPLNPDGSGERGRLRYSPEAADFFGPDGAVGKEASPRIRGIVMHRILSEVAVPDDLEAAVGRAVLRGEITRGEQERITAFLREMIRKAPPEWFPSDRSRLLNETVVLDPAWRSRGGEGQFENRPDRVVRTDGALLVIDYKFGENDPSYRKQVRRYMTLFREMGHAQVRGYLWFLRENGGDFFEEVSL